MKEILNFLKDLKQNNNRDWFITNKTTYESARKEFENLVNRLIPAIYRIDPSIGNLSAKECIFRIFRDVRFSSDKTPYKTHFGAYIAKGGRKSMLAGYYIHLEPGQSMAAGGVHMPPPENLKKIRLEILYHPSEFKNIIQKSSFIKIFHEIVDEKLSRPPKDFPADFPDIELLKYKGYTVVHQIYDEVFLAENPEQVILSAFEELLPFNRFLNRALE